MASSEQVYGDIQNILGQLNPLLEALPNAEDYYKKRVNEAYQYNLPAMKNAAQLESQLYSLPGTLMNQYNTEFGGNAGVNASQRINSILSRLGNQTALTNTAWGVADQAGARINDLINSLVNQYKTGIEAKQTQLSPLMSIWDRLYSEEQASKRARGSGYTNPFKGATFVTEETNTPTSTAPSADLLNAFRLPQTPTAATRANDFLNRVLGRTSTVINK